jgi:hypothetical protein
MDETLSVSCAERGTDAAQNVKSIWRAEGYARGETLT